MNRRDMLKRTSLAAAGVIGSFHGGGTAVATENGFARAKREGWSEWIRTASDRHAVANGCYFDFAAAEHVVTFIERFARHSKGEWAGQPFILAEWQKRELIMPLFGWKRADGTRRFRVAYVEIPKKNGKSALCSAIALYLLVADDEPGAEVYAAAADRDQAGIVFDESKRIVQASPALSEVLEVIDSRKTITFLHMRSKYQALSADTATKEGLNIHGLIFDELHAQKFRTMWDTLRYGGASRRQPLIIAITTAGYDRHSICYEQREYAIRVRDGIVPDDSYFCLIYAADPEDDWTARETWYKANPSLGITINERDFAQACQEAQESPVKENVFKRYRLNIWTEQSERFFQMEKWDACDAPIDMKRLEKQPCFGGLDLSTTLDITAFGLVFRLDDKVVLLPFFWAPEENARQRERKDHVPYLTWARQGLIRLTPGNKVDYAIVRRDINQLRKEYQIKEIAFDRWNSSQLVTELEDDGFTMVEMGQGFASMNAPTKALEEMVVGGEIVHGGNPVLRWMASNTAVRTDPAGNYKPDKEKSGEKIDGIVACIMGLDRLNRHGNKVRVYDDCGLLT